MIKIKPHYFFIYTIPLLCMFSVFTTSNASEYSQPNFYNVTHYTLKNGLRVILKPRHLARNVSIRLKIGVGHNHFACGKQETAHYLEHLLFTGTSTHNENELDNIIESHGGSWNAATGADNTTYEVDIYSKYIDIGLSTLHEIITDSQISEDNVKKSLKIIRRESGGKPSELRNWLHKKGIIYSSLYLASNALFSNPSWNCSEIDQSTSISRNEIINTYKNYYTPDNMTMSIVGYFNMEDTKNYVDKIFGSITTSHNVIRYDIPIPEVNNNLDESIIYNGRFEPLLSTDATVYQIYRTPNMHHKDKVVFDVLEEYFYREMYKLLRVEKGLAYAPSATSGSFDKFGIFLLSTDSEIDDVSTNIELISQVVEKFKNGNLDEKELDEIKLKILLSEARGYETNADFSDYYVENEFELERYGRLLSFTDQIEKVALSDIQRVSKKYFHAGNRVIAVSSPTLTYTQFYILLLIMVVVISMVVWLVIVRMRRKKNSRGVE